MEMKVNARLIRSERESRAWSQQHLASASDLSLRTIQRIEATGSASYESARAIAASFNVQVAEIAADEAAGRIPKKTFARIRAAVLAAVAATVSIVSMQSVLAEQILMDLGVTRTSLSDEREYLSQVLLDDGESIELKMQDKFTINLRANVLDSGDVLIALEFFEFQGDVRELLAEPRVISKNGKQAVIEISDAGDNDSKIRIVVTPNIQ